MYCFYSFSDHWLAVLTGSACSPTRIVLYPITVKHCCQWVLISVRFGEAAALCHVLMSRSRDLSSVCSSGSSQGIWWIYTEKSLSLWQALVFLSVEGQTDAPLSLSCHRKWTRGFELFWRRVTWHRDPVISPSSEGARTA